MVYRHDHPFGISPISGVAVHEERITMGNGLALASLLFITAFAIATYPRLG